MTSSPWQATFSMSSSTYDTAIYTHWPTTTWMTSCRVSTARRLIQDRKSLKLKSMRVSNWRSGEATLIAATYVRDICPHEEVKCSLVMAQSRTVTKRNYNPENRAAVVSRLTTRLSSMNHTRVSWTDSMGVICWFRSSHRVIAVLFTDHFIDGLCTISCPGE